MPLLSSQGSPSATLRRQSTSSSGSTSRETMPCAPRRKSSSVSSSSGCGVTTTTRSDGDCRISSETASVGLELSAASNIKMSAENFLAADKVWAMVSDWPTTRMSSSKAKILRRPARKIACVSATITRMKRLSPSASPSRGCPKLVSTVTGVLAIVFLERSVALKAILIDDHTHATAAIFFKTAYHTATAIELHISRRAHHIGRQRNGEIHQRAHGHFGIQLEEHTVRRNILRFCGARAGFRFHRDRQLDREARRALHIRIASASALFPQLRIDLFT